MSLKRRHRVTRDGRRASYREAAGFASLSFSVMAVLGIVSSIAVARAYGVEVIGDYALVMAPVSATWFLSSFKERPAFVRELATLPARAARVTGLFWAVFAFSLGLTVVVAVVVMLATYFVFRGPIGHPELFVPAVVNMAGYTFFTNTCFNYDSVLSGFRAGRQLFWIRLHQQLMFITAALVASVYFDNVWGLVIATIAPWATALVHRLVVVRQFMAATCAWDELRRGFEALPELLKFGLKIVPGGIADGISNETGTWVLGVIGPTATLGAYNRAWTLGRRLMELNWRVTEMLFPTLVERRAKGDDAGFDRVLLDTIRYAAVGMLLPAAAGGGASRGVMTLFGPGFDEVAAALALILLMPAMSTISNVQRHALYAVERPLTATASAFLRMITTIATSIALSIWLGPAGTALAVILGFAADSAFMFWATRRHLRTRVTTLWPVRQMAALVLAFAAGFLVAHAVYGAIPTYPGVVLALIAGALAYVGVFLASGGVGERDRGRLTDLRAALAARRAAREIARA